ncbi:MAG: hypothetical protein H7A21_02195 [Spirochaetales bacterium]|nr:hypothetical protein [Leptospiraceae bacterium]MCP5480218.1 hypothetical protein [Spirochaetales bacterium]MCP5486383.1 hypothetical protein [Spirochaetales bacterium]
MKIPQEPSDSQLKRSLDLLEDALFQTDDQAADALLRLTPYEFREAMMILEDLTIAQDCAGSETRERRSFAVRSGAIVDLSAGFQPATATTFRSRERPVLFADIVPVDERYVLIELGGHATELCLRLESAGKNGDPVWISLYRAGEIVDKMLLRKRASWQLGGLRPGEYCLQLNETRALQFSIQE